MNLEVVNTTASGDLGKEIDIDRLSTDVEEVDFDPDKYQGAYVRIEGFEPLITVYRTGKYIITGSKSEEEAHNCVEQFLELLSDKGVLEIPEHEWFSMRNYVCTGDLDEPQNLNKLSLKLGMNHTEYEPEQFPGLIFRPENHLAVIFIFSSGKVVITGSKNINVAKEAFQDLKQRLMSNCM